MKMYSKRISSSLLIAVALLLGAWRINMTQAQQNAAPTARALYQQALHEEESTGNLKAAIALYERVLSANPDRELTAQALLRMGECYQKLGDSESRKVYERIVREYSDQKDVATTARARLGTTAGNAGIATRQIWTGPKVDFYGGVSPDGRHITFADWGNGDLAVHDLSTGEDRRLTSNKGLSDPGQYGEQSVFAPDGQQVAYSWISKDGIDLRVVSLNGPRTSTPRVLYINKEIDWISPYDWSRDGKWIAVLVQRKDRTAQLGLVATADGSLRVLKSLDWNGSNRISFSPDGRYLAFDLPAEGSSEQRDVFILAIDGSSLIPAVTHPAEDSVVGWSPDGKHLLFASDRTGKTAIYALAFENGKVQGTASVLNPDVGQASIIGFSRSGTLYYGVANGGRDLLTASVDFESGKIVTPPSQTVPKFIGNNYNPDWSRDGQYLSYESYNRRTLSLALQSLKTGQTRELRPRLASFNFPRWLSDGTSFIAQGYDLKGRQGLYRIDAQSGNVEGMVLSNPGQSIISPVASSDGKKVYYFRGGDGRQTPKAIVEYDIASKVERELPEARCSDLLSIAWDGRSLACGAADPTSKELVLLVVPVSGGASREMVRSKEGNTINFSFTQWTPDGRFIVFGKDGEVWVIPVLGGEARKVDLGAARVLDLRIHADGRRIAFTTRLEKKSEVWAMENLLAPLKEGK